jgi:phage gpG-like protein
MSANGWGMSLSGLVDAIDVLQQLKIEYSSDATYIVGPTVEYAVHHELGTSKMEARPFAQPAAERVQQDLEGKARPFLKGGGGEEAIVRAVALAVEAEMKRIVKQKNIWDTGTLHASIGVEKIE